MTSSENLDPLDRQLRQLVLRAQECPRGTLDYHRALNQLISVLFNCGKLYRPHPNDLPADYRQAHAEIYSEAKQNLMLYLCQHIDEYQPERANVLAWVNFLLKHRFWFGAIQEFRCFHPYGSQFSQWTLDDLEDNKPDTNDDEKYLSTTELIVKRLEDNPEHEFSKIHVKRHPKANLRILILMRLYGQSWQDISASLGVSVPTLSSFYRRKMIQLKKLLQDLTT
ncbi:hypothetical protein PJF56_20480 [Roseofilum sp. BLCC_M91]|uniref:Sigma-70 family RNA polymerase sigma factor n=1 Tax=Roseofilum halophilum BLCC-M91 TaxID=3022259 RepID=A0ABT7BPW6_9CYAN|nr:hypothetical protein [Roseofilum halophilum]MDJ1181242.1 hypothetical protein [Roseofilum halophilum BLCC-M91]